MALDSIKSTIDDTRPICLIECIRNPLEEVILIESVKLREKWGVFQNNCSKEDRLDLTKSEPTIEGVVDLVQEMMTNWASKREKGRRGKALKLFHAFCSKLDSHSSLMRLLPEGNEYVSVFTGALGAIIKVQGFSAAVIHNWSLTKPLGQREP